jgi:AraC-like DNA-binding protein
VAERPDGHDLGGRHQQVKIVQETHGIILGAFSGAATVCAVSTNEIPTCFSPAPSDPVRPRGSGRLQHTHFAAARAPKRRRGAHDRPESANRGALTQETLDSANAVATIRCPCLWGGSMKAGYLHMKRTSQTNALCEIAGRLPIRHLHMPCAEKRRFDEPLDCEFAFQIKAYDFANGYSWPARNGQDGFALIVPLDGSLRVGTGERQIELGLGEILIAQDLNLAARAETEQMRVQVLVISFLPHFVYSLGSPSHDYFFLLPFYGDYGFQASVVREGPSLREIHRIVARLVQCYSDRTSYFEVGCKVLFLELLYHIARQLRDADSIRSEMVLQKDRTARLSPVLEYVERNYADSITLKEAAALAKMSVPQFVRLFKKVAGMSFINYLTHVRLSRSVRLLKESSLTIAEVAYQVGFSDQSYFDRRFKAAFGQTPRDFRLLREETNHVSRGSARPFRRTCAINELAIREAGPFARQGENGSARMNEISSARRSSPCPVHESD